MPRKINKKIGDTIYFTNFRVLFFEKDDLAIYMKDIYSKENSKKRLIEIDNELKVLFVRKNELTKQWKNEKELIEKINKIKKEIDQQKQLAEENERNGDLAKVAEIRYGTLLELEKNLEDTKSEILNIQSENMLLHEIVDSEDIAAVASNWTGIPLSKLLEKEKNKLINMEERIHQRVISQDEAITAVSNAIRRSRAGLQDENRPIGSFIFLGTTGVGKTELAKALAEFLFDDERAMIRFDMSEYSEKHSVSRLIGAPPGYVGYDQGGQLTEVIRNNPYSVVLLDEIEKANPEIFNILLQVLEDGRLTDGKGRTVNFKNTIVIMTSNLGSEYFQESIENNKDINDNETFKEISLNIKSLLKKNLRPEFLNRIDEIIIFRPLKIQDITKIVDLQIGSLSLRLAQKNINLSISDKAKQVLSEKGYDIQNGARPLKRLIQSNIIDSISMMILEEKLKIGDTVYIDIDQFDNFVFPINIPVNSEN